MIGVLLTPAKPTVIPPESQLTFRVETPVTISTERSQQAFQIVTPQDFPSQNYDYYRDRLANRPRYPTAGYPPYPAVAYPAPPPYYYYGYGYPYPYWGGPYFGARIIYVPRHRR